MLLQSNCAVPFEEAPLAALVKQVWHLLNTNALVRGMPLIPHATMRFTVKRNYNKKRRNAMKLNLDFAAGAIAGICLMHLVQIIRHKGNSR